MFETHIQQGLEAIIKSLSKPHEKYCYTDKAAPISVEASLRRRAKEPNGAMLISHAPKSVGVR
ncbi:MAG TPA: hypothetical protein VGD99_08740 [Anaerolineae bacterium]|jgi:hypothetical protein